MEGYDDTTLLSFFFITARSQADPWGRSGGQPARAGGRAGGRVQSRKADGVRDATRSSHHVLYPGRVSGWPEWFVCQCHLHASAGSDRVGSYMQATDPHSPRSPQPISCLVDEALGNACVQRLRAGDLRSNLNDRVKLGMRIPREHRGRLGARVVWRDRGLLPILSFPLFLLLCPARGRRGVSTQEIRN